MPPATQEKDADTAAASAASGKRLQPLGRGLAVPPGAAPRSAVPSVRYDLAVSGTGESLDDGVPGDEPREIFERGGASWYGIQFHQRKTANGERFDMGAMTAAHKTLPFNTRVCVRSLVNGSEVLVRVNDRGPFTPGRIIDLSRAAADRIGLTGLGIKQVALSVIDREGMRCGGEAVAAGDLQAAPEAPTSRVRAPAPARKRVIVPPRKRR
ncbi:MAG: septal ring lytic transglycosylase RlpA family protein [Pseudomonadota bacterium]